MSESIIFRAFEESDSPALEQVIRETWRYDRFCTPQDVYKRQILLL